MRSEWIKVFGIGSVLAAGVAGADAKAESTFVLEFEGLGVDQVIPGVGRGHIEGVGDFYNGGRGANGSGPGFDYGLEFSSNALAIIDADANGRPQHEGNFGGEPSGETVLFFLEGDAATVTSRQGFTDGFSFYYSSFRFPSSVTVYSGPEGTGDVLATLDLPTTPRNGAPDPTGEFSPFVPIGVEFDGVAMSIDFAGTINQVGFDNITFGSATPIVNAGSDGPIGGGGSASPTVAPSPTAAAGGALLLGLMCAKRRRAEDK